MAKPTISSKKVRGEVHLTVEGELDIAAAPHLKEALAVAAATGRPVVVDMGGVTFCDSTGLGVLVGGHKRTRAEGASMRIENAPEMLRKTFALTGLDKVLDISPGAAGG